MKKKESGKPGKPGKQKDGASAMAPHAAKASKATQSGAAKKPPSPAKPAKAAKPPKAAKAGKSKKHDEAEEEIEGADLMADLAELGGLGKLLGKPKGGSSDRKDDDIGLDKVMASLTQIFGGKDFMSDAELDALLESKFASGEIPPSADLDPLDEAQSLIYEAWNSEDVVKVELAHRALDLCPDCADAYIILAEEEADSREAALSLYLKAVEAGKRALDPKIFQEAAGDFWALMETRPYMRARLGLALCLRDLGKREEALGHLRDLLRLNPADNQGARHVLLQCLLEWGADEELGDLLARYAEDTSPSVGFTRALWLFRRHGPGKAANAALQQALRSNPHVSAFLLKRKPLSKQILPDVAAGGPGEASGGPGVAAGSPEEAEAYARGAMRPWQGTLGALEWLAGHAPA
jgi:tetratricopeptide (TPR) repeat protein